METSVDVVGSLVVDGDSGGLTNAEILEVEPVLSVVAAQVDSAIVTDPNMIGVAGVEVDSVMVNVDISRDCIFEVLAAIEGAKHWYAT